MIPNLFTTPNCKLNLLHQALEVSHLRLVQQSDGKRLKHQVMHAERWWVRREPEGTESCGPTLLHQTFTLLLRLTVW